MYDILFKTIDRIEELENGTGSSGSDPDFLQRLVAMRETLAAGGSPAPEPRRLYLLLRRSWIARSARIPTSSRIPSVFPPRASAPCTSRRKSS